MVDSLAGTPRIVGIGGGNGVPRLLRGLRERIPAASIAAVVATSDTGRSTGVVREALRMPAPGDLRHCLTTLAGDASPWAQVLEQRLAAPGHPHLDGMAIGNLVLGVLTQQTGDIGEATDILGRLLGTDAAVLPVTSSDAHLVATLEDGSVVRGETAVRGPDKPPIREVSVEGDGVTVWHRSARTLQNATAVIIGPGSLWTSLAASLSVPGVREAIPAASLAVFVCNTTTQRGQTDGVGVLRHVEVIARYLGRAPDIVVLNSGRPPTWLEASLARDGLCILQASSEERAAIRAMGSNILAHDLLARSSGRTSLWNKQDTAYHDADLVASLLASHLHHGSDCAS